jgi:hypothetical protein
MLITINEREIHGFTAYATGFSLSVKSGEIWITEAYNPEDRVVSAGTTTSIPPGQKVVLESISAVATFSLSSEHTLPFPRLQHATSQTKTNCA